MPTVVADYIRTARKEYRCARQVYFDRLSPESREWQRATVCPHGGVIRVGEQYAATEGANEFHPTRQHTDCLQWTGPNPRPAREGNDGSGHRHIDGYCIEPGCYMHAPVPS